MLLCDVCSIVLWTRGPYEFPAAIVTGNWKWKCFFFFSRVPAAVLSVCSQWRPLPLFLTYCLIIPAAVMLASGKVISPPSLFCGLHNTTPLVYLFFFFIVKRRFSFLHTESILRGSGRNRSSFFFVCSSDPRRLVFFIAPLLHTKERKNKKSSFWESDWIIRSGHWLSFIISRMEKKKKKKRPVACCWWDVIALPSSSSPPPPPSFFL